MESLSQIEPIYYFMGVGIVSVLVARYGTHIVMPPWIEFSLRWGGWALIFLGLMQFFGVIEFLDLIPI